jgi:DNA-binding MarR family transcriptional regulator
MVRRSAYDSDEALKLENQLCFPLYAASRKIVSAYTPYLKPLGITYTQYITFMVLWEEDGLFVGDICTRLRLDNGTLTPLLKKMEKQGFVVRRRDETDERKVRVFLTDEGRAMKERVRDIPRKVGSCVDLNTEEARTLYRLLYKLLDEA